MEPGNCVQGVEPGNCVQGVEPGNCVQGVEPGNCVQGQVIVYRGWSQVNCVQGVEPSKHRLNDLKNFICVGIRNESITSDVSKGAYSITILSLSLSPSLSLSHTHTHTPTHTHTIQVPGFGQMGTAAADSALKHYRQGGTTWPQAIACDAVVL